MPQAAGRRQAAAVLHHNRGAGADVAAHDNIVQRE